MAGLGQHDPCAAGWLAVIGLEVGLVEDVHRLTEVPAHWGIVDLLPISAMLVSG